MITRGLLLPDRRLLFHVFWLHMKTSAFPWFNHKNEASPIAVLLMDHYAAFFRRESSFPWLTLQELNLHLHCCPIHACKQQETINRCVILILLTFSWLATTRPWPRLADGNRLSHNHHDPDIQSILYPTVTITCHSEISWSLNVGSIILFLVLASSYNTLSFR